MSNHTGGHSSLLLIWQILVHVKTEKLNSFLFYLDGNSQFLNTHYVTVEIDYSHLIGIEIYSVRSLQSTGTPLRSYSIY